MSICPFWLGVVLLVLQGALQTVAFPVLLVSVGRVFKPEGGVLAGLKTGAELWARGSSTTPMYVNLAVSMAIGVLLIAAGVIAALRRPWSRVFVVTSLAGLIALDLFSVFRVFQLRGGEAMRDRLDGTLILVLLLIIFVVPRTWRAVTATVETVTDVTA